MPLRILGTLLFLLAGITTSWSMPPPEAMARLSRGISITNWFRYPGSTDPALLASYLSEAALADLALVGFTFVRLPVQPEMLTPARLPALIEAIARIERRQLGVVVDLHPAAWRLEDQTADRRAFLAAWRVLAPALRRFGPRSVFPELLNEPVFATEPGAWALLQADALAIVREHLPAHTVILTGGLWGGIDGLLALSPVADPNVLYSVHFYEPAEMTSLAAYRSGLDRSALARLPFPVTDAAACQTQAAAPTDAATGAIVRFVCGQRWDEARIARRIGAAAAWGRRYGAAVLLGEFGASSALNRRARLAWIAGVRTACEHQGMGWGLWGYDDVMGFDVTRPPGSRPVLDVSLLNALGLRSP